MLGALRKRIERCRRFGNITRNGIVFDWELAGPNGASYELFRQPNHSDEDIACAISQLRADHDVVSLSVTKVSEEELAAPIPPDPVFTRPILDLEKQPFHTILPRDVSEQRIYFQDRFWSLQEGAFRRLGISDIGRRLILVRPNKLEIETLAQLTSRTAAFTQYPRGGDAVRLCAPWKFATTLQIGAYGFIDGAVNGEHLISVEITFNSVPFVDESYCSASGGPGSIATPIAELKPTSDRVALRCWRWNDGYARAHNGSEYMRVCRVWDWYPNKNAS
jgi:hypothetical protein